MYLKIAELADLNAQTHAQGFYERCGFVLDGEEFMEAGIPHVRMIQELSPPVDNVQRRALASPDLDVSVKAFDMKTLGWFVSSQFLIDKLLYRQPFSCEPSDLDRSNSVCPSFLTN